ncbi:MAG: DUF192 domain-containing protein [Candidatus Bathyarchaeia archaeon]
MNRLILGSLLFLLVTIGVAGYSWTQAQDNRILVGNVLLVVEIANTPSAQQKGLSGRTSLPSDHGMLFVFDHEDYWGFWMVDMNFPLDIIWFNSSRQVVFIEQNLPPCTPQNCPVFTPDLKAMYVLEVNAGFVTAHQIGLGTTFTFLNT